MLVYEMQQEKKHYSKNQKIIREKKRGNDVENKYILNDKFGINGIEKVSFTEIINTFSYPDSIEISKDRGSNNLTVSFYYDSGNLEIVYFINYYLKSKIVEMYNLMFVVKKLYLNDKEYIKNGQDIRKVLTKIRKYFKKKNKKFEFEYEEHMFGGSYIFEDPSMTLYFDKEDDKKYLDDIYVGLPYEDYPEVLSVGELLDLVKPY